MLALTFRRGDSAVLNTAQGRVVVFFSEVSCGKVRVAFEAAREIEITRHRADNAPCGIRPPLTPAERRIRRRNQGA